MAKFRDFETFQKFASTHAAIDNHFKLERHLTNWSTFRQRRSAVIAERGEITI